MTRDEFNEWRSHYCNCFPLTGQWLNDLPNKGRDTLQVWFKCLERFSAIVCTTVTDRMAYGELKPVEAYERDKTALIVRGYAGRIIDDERKQKARMAARIEARVNSGRTGVAFPAGKLFALAKKIWEEGREVGTPDEQIRAEVSTKLDAYLDELVPPQQETKFDEFAGWSGQNDSA